jgi:hypothetical protein
MALTTYTDVNANGDPITMTVIDSATASTPGLRPSAFTPLAGYPTLTTATDYSVGSTPTKRPETFEPPSLSCTLDPGMIVNG